VVARSGGGQTYLLFSAFDMSLGQSAPSEVEVYTNDGSLLTLGEHFAVDDGTVRSTPGWSGQLSEARVQTVVVE